MRITGKYEICRLDKCLCRHFQKKLKKDRGYCFRPFYNQITPYDVIRWLFNFDDEDVELAVQLLEHVIFCVMTM